MPDPTHDTTHDTAARTPKEIVELVRRMVGGDESVVYADLFAADGVIEYPFAVPGWPERVAGREAIRAHYGQTRSAAVHRLIRRDSCTAEVHGTEDPEVVVAQIEHHGWSYATGAPYRFVGVVIARVRAGEIVHFRDFMNPIAVADLVGRRAELVAALTG